MRCSRAVTSAVLLTLPLATVLTACSSSVTTDDVRSAAVSIGGTEMTLSDGKASSDAGDLVLNGQVARGDLDGENGDDAAVVATLTKDDVASTYLLAFTDSGDAPTALPAAYLGQGVSSSGLAIGDSGSISLTVDAVTDSYPTTQARDSVAETWTYAADASSTGSDASASSDSSASSDTSDSSTSGPGITLTDAKVSAGKGGSASVGDPEELMADRTGSSNSIDKSDPVVFGAPHRYTVTLKANESLAVTQTSTEALVGVSSEDQADLAKPASGTEPVKLDKPGEGTYTIQVSAPAGQVVDDTVSIAVTSPEVKKTKEGLPTYGPNGKKALYLTFDDGPSEFTPQILEVLEKHGAKAVFFELGQNAKTYPEYHQDVLDAGMVVASHTWDHPQLTKLSDESVTKQITDADAVLGQTKCLRPPYGAVNKSVRQIIEDQGKQVVLWDIDPEDWSRPGVSKIVSTVEEYAHPGAILLEHDGGGERSQTVEALDQYLTDLEAQGYEFPLIPFC